MGGIWMNNHDFADSLAEVVGFKSGLVLSRARTVKLLGEFDQDLAARMQLDEARVMRMESTTFEEAVSFLLFKVGNIASPVVLPPVATLYHRYKHDPVQSKIAAEVGRMFADWLGKAVREPAPQAGYDPTPLLKRASKAFGVRGAEIAIEYMDAAMAAQHRSPWGRMRRQEWEDARDLEDLFRSEQLESQYGQFFDQRFIDYIAQNFDEIDDIHWRQFEGMTAEWFDRQGFRVDLGPGRNDDGVDVRVFPKEDDPSLPPLIIVQCKRERRKIGKTLVKSVYADVLHEQAGSGLIVTTTELSPGADKLRLARGYPVDAIPRGKLKEWIAAMRSSEI